MTSHSNESALNPIGGLFFYWSHFIHDILFGWSLVSATNPQAHERMWFSNIIYNAPLETLCRLLTHKNLFEPLGTHLLMWSGVVMGLQPCVRSGPKLVNHVREWQRGVFLRWWAPWGGSSSSSSSTADRQTGAVTISVYSNVSCKRRNRRRATGITTVWRQPRL